MNKNVSKKSALLVALAVVLLSSNYVAYTKYGSDTTTVTTEEHKHSKSTKKGQPSVKERMKPIKKKIKRVKNEMSKETDAAKKGMLRKKLNQLQAELDELKSTKKNS